jgi:hypothetical protein
MTAAMPTYVESVSPLPDSILSLTRNSELGTEVLSIYVGRDKKEVRVHRNLLLANAPQLEQFLNIKQENSEYVLQGLDVDAFCLVIEWLYRRKLPKPNTEREDGWEARTCNWIRKHIRLYMLAEQFNIKDIADAAMENIGVSYFMGGFLPTNKEMELVFSKCDPESPLRNYMIKAFNFSLFSFSDAPGSPESSRSTESLWRLAKNHEDVGRAVFQSLRSTKTKNDANPWDGLICDDHQHDRFADCPSKGVRYSKYKNITGLPPFV